MPHGCVHCGLSGGSHSSGCKPDDYISPHKTLLGTYPCSNHAAHVANIAAHKYAGNCLRHTEPSLEWQEWLEARERYAENPVVHPLDTVLMHVTEENPPPGPPLSLYKPKPPAKPPLRKGVAVSVVCWLGFLGLYATPAGAHGYQQVILFCVLSTIWLGITWTWRRTALIR